MRRPGGFRGGFRAVAFLAAFTALFGMQALPARADLPVEFNFLSGIRQEIANHGGSLPGTNDWSCKLTAAHPDPVILVHGAGGGGQTDWGVYAPLLADAGYCVYSTTYGAYTQAPWPLSAFGGLHTTEETAADLAVFIDGIRSATGASKVDIVAHSQGMLVTSYYTKRLGGAAKVAKQISLGPNWLGSNSFQVADIRDYVHALGGESAFDAMLGFPCQSCNQVVRGSAFLRDLQRDGVYTPGISYTNIVTRNDEVVVPYTAGLVSGPNVTNIVVQDGCAADASDHMAIVASPRAAGFVLNALDPDHAVPPPCEYIPPYVG